MLLNTLVTALASGGLIAGVFAGPVSLQHAADVHKVKRDIPSTHRLHERHLPHWSHQWTRKNKIPDSQVLPMRIGLKQCNLEAGHDKLMDM